MIEDGQVYNPYKIFFGSYIPNWLMKTREISPAAKLLWSLLVRHAGKDGICYPGYEILSEETGYGIDNIGKQIRELQGAKLIRVIKPSGMERLRHRNNRYEFIWNSDIIEKSDLYDNTGAYPYDNQDDKSTLIVNKTNIKETVTNVTVKHDSEKSCFSESLPNRFQRLSPIPELPSQEELIDDYIKPGTGEYAVINAWNKLLPPARQHTKFNTNIILQITRYLDQMRNGVFGDPSRRHWDGKWIDRHKINMKEFAERKWTFREICKTIEGPLGDVYKEGFWPQDKSKLPKSLADALYNSHTQSSFFVMAYYDPPGPLKSQPMKDPHKGITEDLVSVWSAIDPKTMKPGDWRQYSQGIKGLEKYLENINWENYGARQMFPGGQKGNPYTLVMEYARWMAGQSSDLLAPSRVVERINWSMIRPDFWMWRKFQEVVNRYWGKVFKNVIFPEDG